MQKNPQPRNPALKHKDKELDTFTARFLIFLKKSLFGNVHREGKAKMRQSPPKDRKKSKRN